VIKTNGINFYNSDIKTEITEFEGTKLINDLHVNELKENSETFKYLNERGLKFIK